jgi:hypothetical protein
MTFLERQLEDPVRFARLKRIALSLLLALFLAEAVAPWMLYDDPAHFPFEDLPAFGSVYGFAACIAIIVVSKMIGKLWLLRPERYYDR